ncbi:MAG: hypothetical protein AAFU79_19630, partial [Myxococcota bacterium]
SRPDPGMPCPGQPHESRGLIVDLDRSDPFRVHFECPEYVLASVLGGASLSPARAETSTETSDAIEVEWMRTSGPRTLEPNDHLERLANV